MNSTLKTQNAGNCTHPPLSPEPGLSPDSKLLSQSGLEGVGIGVLWRHVVQSDSAASSLHPGLSVAVKHKQLAVGLHNKQHRVSQSCHKHPTVSPQQPTSGVTVMSQTPYCQPTTSNIRCHSHVINTLLSACTIFNIPVTSHKPVVSPHKS